MRGRHISREGEGGQSGSIWGGGGVWRGPIHICESFATPLPKTASWFLPSRRGRVQPLLLSTLPVAQCRLDNGQRGDGGGLGAEDAGAEGNGGEEGRGAEDGALVFCEAALRADENSQRRWDESREDGDGVSAILGFVKRALTHTGGEHADVTGWYAAFLQHVVVPNAAVFSFVITGGELLVGLGLLLGAFTGIAAFFGLTMNASYLLGGTVSVNPILAIIGIFVILAWRNAGWIGLDRYLLPALGTPWQPGKIGRHDAAPAPAAS